MLACLVFLVLTILVACDSSFEKQCNSDINTDVENVLLKAFASCINDLETCTKKAIPIEAADNQIIPIKFEKNQCYNNPCVNGSCINVINNYTCACRQGFTGRNCSVDINECKNDLCVNGNCIDLINNYTCACRQGFTGRNCSVDINECKNDPCVNGNCIDLINNYTCTCQQGFTGRNCNIGCRWTQFFDRDDPSGTGDHETLKSINIKHPGKACSNPSAVEARVKSTKQDYRTTGQIFYIDPAVGFRCWNNQQVNGKKCLDYEVRFCCPRL